MILISACLCGLCCRYDGSSAADVELMRLVEMGKAVPVCPELLGGLLVPRLKAEIQGGSGDEVLLCKARVCDCAGGDVTDAFIKGAYKTLQLALSINAKHAILKANSPSCGCATIYDGTFSGKTKQGDGVTAALLKQNGIRVEPR